MGFDLEKRAGFIWKSLQQRHDQNADTNATCCVPVGHEPDAVEAEAAADANAPAQQRGSVKRGRPRKSTPAPQANVEVGPTAHVLMHLSISECVQPHHVPNSAWLASTMECINACHSVQDVQPEAQQTKKRKLLSKAGSAALGRAQNPPADAKAPSDAARKQTSARNPKSKATSTSGARGRKHTVSAVCPCHVTTWSVQHSCHAPCSLHLPAARLS